MLVEGGGLGVEVGDAFGCGGGELGVVGAGLEAALLLVGGLPRVHPLPVLGGVEQFGVEVLRGEDGLAGGDRLLGERRLQVAGAQIVVELRAVPVAVLGEVERGVVVAGVGEQVQVLRRGEVGVVRFVSGLVMVGGLLGVGRGRVGEGCGPVDQGVSEGVVGDGVAVEADRLT